MTMSPRFSVVIPLYNKEKDILKTLDSLQQQQFQEFEIIIVDDGSTDNSSKLVKEYEDSRIRFFSKENEGVAPTRNFGVKQAMGDYIAFLDADDYWYPFHLEDLDDLISRFPDGKWFATAYEKRFNEKLTVSMESPILEKGSNWKGEVDDYASYCYADCIAWTSAVCFKKVFFEELAGFDTSITMGAGEDTDLWLRAALASPLIFTNNISATHNLAGSNRITLSPTLKRRFWDMTRYDIVAEKSPTLKKYLDISRFSIALQYKIAGDIKTAASYAQKIDGRSLTVKQRFLLKAPKGILRILYSFKKKMEGLGWRTSSFEI
jgi:glycosyltransferase involved in cell wall biosynthesis